MTGASQTIPLVTGDPSGANPASFTRFVLPFAWVRVPCTEAQSSGLSWSKPDPTSPDAVRLVARRQYFTSETSEVLFERATWLHVNGWPEERRIATLTFGDRSVGLRIAAPRVVLFEGSGRAPTELSTGFLLVDIRFAPETLATLDDLLTINELVRYWREPFAGHRGGQRDTSDGPLAHTQTASLLSCGGEHLYCDAWAELLTLPVIDDATPAWCFVSEDAAKKARTWITSPTRESGWICYTDARAFVHSCALTAGGAFDLAQNGEAPEQSGDWIRLLNVDPPSTAAATPFERNWASPGRTFERWKHFGTLYGFSTHSAVMIGKPCPEPPTWQHFSDMYFDQVLLLLYLRVTTFRFSAKLSWISGQLATPSRKDTENARRSFADLRRAFAFFTNLYRFPLLSSQQQGIEMYGLARQALDVDALFEEVQKEIESTHELFELVTANKQQVASTKLGWVAGVAGSVGLAVAFAETGPGAELASGLARYVPAPFASSILMLLVFLLLMTLTSFFLARPTAGNSDSDDSGVS